MTKRTGKKNVTEKKSLEKKEGEKGKKVKIIFLGGVGEIGKNMTCLEYGGDIIVIDAGLTFPGEQTPGIDYIIPDFNYLLQNAGKVKGFLLTHGHEDHIGALPMILKSLNVPVYGSRLTLGLLRHKLDEAKIKDANLCPVSGLDCIKLGAFGVEFLSITHSVAGALALSITTPAGTIFHTGDFKIDHTPVDGKTVDLPRIAEIGKAGVRLLMMDSTNVERSGYSLSESKVFRSLDNIFSQHENKRIIVATFSSNVHRVQQIIDCAVKHGRRVAFSGRSMTNVTEIAHTLGELKFNRDIIVDLEKSSKVPYDKICIIATGTQGEEMSALTRMSNDNFKQVVIGSNDTVIMSSSAIPGNERMIYNVINNLAKRGAQVIYHSLEDIHASGHACKEELKLMFALLKPQFFIPVHGEYRHLKEHIQLAAEMGIAEEYTLMPELGMVAYLSKSSLKKAEIMPTMSNFVDGGGVADEPAALMRDRRTLAADGFVVAIIMTKTFELNPPIILSRGVRLSDELVEEIKSGISAAIATADGDYEITALKQHIRKLVFKTVEKKTKKKPMIIPIIIET